MDYMDGRRTTDDDGRTKDLREPEGIGGKEALMGPWGPGGGGGVGVGLEGMGIWGNVVLGDIGGLEGLGGLGPWCPGCPEAAWKPWRPGGAQGAWGVARLIVSFNRSLVIAS